MAVDPNLVYALRLHAFETEGGKHPGPPPPGYRAPGGQHDGETSAETALRRLEETAAEAAEVVISIAKDDDNSPAVRLNAAKYILDLCQKTTGANGDPLLDMMKAIVKSGEK
jgi:hypothetical protein